MLGAQFAWERGDGVEVGCGEGEDVVGGEADEGVTIDVEGPDEVGELGVGSARWVRWIKRAWGETAGGGMSDQNALSEAVSSMPTCDYVDRRDNLDHHGIRSGNETM